MKKDTKTDILSVLEQRMASFSKGQRTIARYILGNYDKAAFMTAARMGEAVGVSESTVVRFAVELGYRGYPGMKKAHLPRLLYYGASLVSRIRYGYSFSQMKPIAALSDCDVPMLFLHGGEDALISPEDSLRMSRAVKGYSEYHQIVGAGHAESVLKQPKRYRQLVNSFLNTIGC